MWLSTKSAYVNEVEGYMECFTDEPLNARYGGRGGGYGGGTVC